MGFHVRHARVRFAVVVTVLALTGVIVSARAETAHAATVPTFAVGSASVVEGDAGTRTIYVPVTLTDPAQSQVSIAYAVGSGSATASVDFKAKVGTLIFKPSGATGRT